MGICQSHIQQQTEKCDCVMINVPQSGCGKNFKNFNVVIFSGAIKSIAAKVWGGGGYLLGFSFSYQGHSSISLLGRN